MFHAPERFGSTELALVWRDGGSPILLTSQVGADDGPSWSPDGRSIAFSSERGGNRDIWTAR